MKGTKRIRGLRVFSNLDQKSGDKNCFLRLGYYRSACARFNAEESFAKKPWYVHKNCSAYVRLQELHT